MLNLADKIADEIYKKYDSLGKSGKPNDGQEWTLLAGFLMGKNDKLEVLSLATGTKCIGINSMCPDGLIVNDSHAEVLARRSFLRYLYSEIISLKQNGISNIFTGLNMDGKFMLNEEIDFYFFTSHVPCGDAAIIPMNDIDNFKRNSLKRSHDMIDNEQDKLMSDIHRTGAKPVKYESRQDPHGSGENYHIKGAVRIKPGRGDPTLSLSCSDKIARWIFVGVQGSLISQLIDKTIRISAIIVGGGGQFNKDILEDSLIKRSKSEYIPKLLQSGLIFKHSVVCTKNGRPSPTSIIWANIKNEKPQISVNGKKLGTTKKNKGNSSSLFICKRELFKTFLSINDVSIDYLNLTYREAKDLCIEYQDQTRIFKQAMGAWSESKIQTQKFRISKEELTTT